MKDSFIQSENYNKMFLFTVSVLLSVAYFATTEELNDDIIVQLRAGKIRGHILKSGYGNDYYAFQEIPFAAPPVKENRFELPKQVNPWTGVLNTTKNTKICYQPSVKYSNLEISEDCLYVNVYTPVKPGSISKELPVLVWVHGGGYAQGAGTFEYFGPTYIMDYGVVVVTVQYRLGPFGFATTEDDVVPANLGLKDQKFALEWESENIHLFSGNSQQVTLAGRSAGSFSVGLQVLAQKDNENELFHAAIMQSGSPILGRTVQDNARETLFNCVRTLDGTFTSNQSSDLLKVLQEASAADIFEACIEAIGPIIEKKGDYSYAPYQSFMDGSFRKIPILMGFTSEEWLSRVARDKDVNNTLISFDNDPRKLVPTSINISPENRTIAGKLLKKFYTENFENDLGAYVRWSSDSVMVVPVCKQAELTASQMPVYLYQFSYDGKLGTTSPITIPGAERVSHTEDGPYMWNDGTNSDLSKFSKEDQLTLRRFIKMWTNFVKYQNPTPENDILLNNLRWTTTNSQNLRYFNFNATLEMKEYPRQYVNVRKVLDKYMEPPYNYY